MWNPFKKKPTAEPTKYKVDKAKVTITFDYGIIKTVEIEGYVGSIFNDGDYIITAHDRVYDWIKNRYKDGFIKCNAGLQYLATSRIQRIDVEYFDLYKTHKDY